MAGADVVLSTGDQVTVAMDAMGGDYAPREIIKGACEGAMQWGARLLLVGDEEAIRRDLQKIRTTASIDVIHAPERIEMGENPAAAIRRKRNSSLVRCAEMVRDGKAHAMVSAGNTGATMAVAALILGRAPGIDRPGIATVLPTISGQVVLLDVGANVDCSVQNLIQFATMGSVYSRDVMGIKNPRVGLLSIGAEPSKGNELSKAAYKVLVESDLNFVGNIEGGPLFEGAADVVVCDGFVGNVALKVAEGVANMIQQIAARKLRSRLWYKLMLLGLAPGIRQFQKEIDCAEVGGAPLLGVNGICIVCHGNSRAKSISSALRLAVRAQNNDVLENIGRALEQPALHAAHV